MSQRSPSERVRIVVIVVVAALVLGGLFTTGVVVTRRGPGGVVHIHNVGKASLAGVRVTSGAWSLDVPAIEADGTFDVEVPRGQGPTWEVKAPVGCVSSNWGLCHPFGGEESVAIKHSKVEGVGEVGGVFWAR